MRVIFKISYWLFGSRRIEAIKVASQYYTDYERHKNNYKSVSRRDIFTSVYICHKLEEQAFFLT